MKIYLGDTTQKITSVTGEVVKNLIDEGKRCIVFSEDKITLSLELEIASRLGGGFFNVDVLTFRRYISSKNVNSKVMSKEGSVMLVRKIITELKNHLGCFKHAVGAPNMALVLYELISQLESAKISPQELQDLVEKETNLQPALVSKIQDVVRVYKEYDQRIKDLNLYDSNDYLSLMPDLVKNDENLKNSAVIIVGFQSVTRQRYDVFEALYQTAESFHAVIPYDSESELFTGETFDRLNKICKKPTVINKCGNLPSEAEFIKKNLFNPLALSKDFKSLKTEKVSIFQAVDLKSEAEWLAKDLLFEIRENGYRYNDITVAVGSLADTLQSIEKTFRDYGVPYFVEKSTALAEHPVCDFIVSLLDFQRKGLLASDFVKIVGSSLFLTNKRVADKFINYVYANSINRRAFKTPFTAKHESLETFETMRQKVMTAVEKLSNAKTVFNFVEALRFALQTFGVYENLNELSCSLKNSGNEVLADYNGKIEEKLNALFDEMNFILGSSLISPLDFKNLFLSGAVGTAISAIPILADAVYIGECKDVKVKSAKVLYAFGLNGDVPFTQSDTALLSDGDLSVLDGFNVIVEPKIKSVNLREKENVLSTLISFTDKLKISYSNEKYDGSKNLKSDAIKSLEKLFKIEPISATGKDYISELDEEKFIKDVSSSFVNDSVSLMEIAKSYCGYKNSDKETLSKIASFYKAIEELQRKDLKDKANALLSDSQAVRKIDDANNLSFKGGEISASVLEAYFSCPYKNYASYMLRLKESPILDVKVNETGILLHEVNELFCKNISKVSDKISCDNLVGEIFNEIEKNEKYKKYLSSNKLLFTLKRLKKECERVCFNIYSSIKNSSFMPSGYEVKFGVGEDIPPIILNTEVGDMKVKGVVDRVDRFSNYVRVIDYKSGKILSDEEHFYTGNKIQLYLYMNAFISDKVRPAGAYYYPVQNSYQKEEFNYCMRGKTVNTNEVIHATDNTLAPGEKSTIVSVSINKKDGLPSAKSAVLSVNEMDKFLQYAKLVSAQGVNEISQGNIEPSPYEGACNYCQYGGMCGFCQDEGGSFRKVSKANVQTITGAVDSLQEGDENE